MIDTISATENKILIPKYLNKNLMKSSEEYDDIVPLENKISKRDSNSQIGVNQIQRESMSEGITEDEVIEIIYR